MFLGLRYPISNIIHCPLSIIQYPLSTLPTKAEKKRFHPLIWLLFIGNFQDNIQARWIPSKHIAFKQSQVQSCPSTAFQLPGVFELVGHKWGLWRWLQRGAGESFARPLKTLDLYFCREAFSWETLHRWRWWLGLSETLPGFSTGRTLFCWWAGIRLDKKGSRRNSKKL